MKECGDCALCCKLIEVLPLDKPAGKWCQHCTKQSCSIWKERPRICRSYECLWRLSEPMGEVLRPSNCHIVFELYEPEKTVVALVDQHYPESWGKGEPLKLIKRMVMDGYTVWIMVGKDRHVMLPQGETQGSAVLRAQRARNRVMEDGGSLVH